MFNGNYNNNNNVNCYGNKNNNTVAYCKQF